MPHAKLICPHCDATLRPAKPVQEGKTVKCPKCAKTFKAPDEEDAPAVKAVAAKAKPAPAKKKAVDEDDDDGGTYAVARDLAEEARKAAEEERRERKKRRRQEEDYDPDEEDEDEDEEEDVGAQYLKNLKKTDPRGPAQEAVVGPSNWLLRTALVGFFGWAVTFVVFMIPVAFPNIDKKEDVDPRTGRPIVEAGEKDKKKEAPKPPVFELKMILASNWYVAGFVVLVMLGMIHASLIAVGSVKMNSLESHGWGMASSILTILPLHVLPVYYFLWSILEWIVDDAGVFVAMIILLWGPIVGISCLLVLKKPGVKAGFEYRTD